MGNKKKTKEIDVELVQDGDGVYVQKTTHHPLVVQQKKKQHKNVEDFLDGVDKGFDFLESINERIDRFFKLGKRISRSEK
jgi:hypothetical protein